MSVFTTVTPDDMRRWLQDFDLGTLVSLEGIASGIENTNYFVTTSAGRYVLTLFEKLTAPELPFFLDLVEHLADRGVPCPRPMANRAGQTLGALNGKPACLAQCLPGRSVESPSAAQCAAIGDALAKLHLGAADYARSRVNPRAEAWWNGTEAKLAPLLDAAARQLLTQEIQHQNQADRSQLPAGVIHADLFCDNALFDGERLGGIIDFYFACTDYWLYDLAITVNDWCATPERGLDPARARALINAYHQVRPLTAAEHRQWGTMLRRAALRFWVSRLDDLHFPRPGEMTFAKDPAHFQRMLEHHVRHQAALDALLPATVA